MRLARQLARWQAEGLLDAATAERIARHEAERRNPLVLPAMVALGAAAIALGLLSIVAANWAAIPGRMKIAVDLAIGVALAVATARAALRGSALATDGLATVLWGFTLASIALVGQVWQVQSPAWRALLTWAAATTPLLLLAKSRAVATFFATGWMAAQAACWAAIFDWLGDDLGLTPHDASNAMLVAVAAAPLPWLFVARWPRFLREHPLHARVAEEIGWFGVAGLGAVACLAWYSARGAEPEIGWGVLGVGLVAIALVALLPRLYPEWKTSQRAGVALAIGIAWAALALGDAFPRRAAGWVGAIAQILFFAALAWAAAEGREERLFRLLTAAIGLRLLGVYFEVFGSLLNTGLGLVAGGLLTLALVWLWRHPPRLRGGGGEAGR
ncbi:MAG: DUF2157 domain-containing protein [Alphaproteobacteria bacterium]